MSAGRNWIAEIKVCFTNLLISAGGKTSMPCLVDLLRIAVQEYQFDLVSLLVVHQEITSDVATEVMDQMDQLPPDALEDSALKMTDLLFEAEAAGKDLGAMLA
jgi:hypothetical protein